GSCFHVTGARAGDAEDWPACCHFLAVQLHGFERVGKEGRGEANPADMSAVDLVMMAGEELAGKGGQLLEIALKLGELRERLCDGKEVAVPAAEGVQWPMSFQEIVTAFALEPNFCREWCQLCDLCDSVPALQASDSC
ncbi:unnamed protein product, partial [Durusdinium trenchii]